MFCAKAEPYKCLVRGKGSNFAYTLTNAVNRAISLGTDPVRFLPDKSLATRVRV